MQVCTIVLWFDQDVPSDPVLGKLMVYDFTQEPISQWDREYGSSSVQPDNRMTSPSPHRNQLTLLCVIFQTNARSLLSKIHTLQQTIPPHHIKAGKPLALGSFPRRRARQDKRSDAAPPVGGSRAGSQFVRPDAQAPGRGGYSSSFATPLTDDGMWAPAAEDSARRCRRRLPAGSLSRGRPGPGGRGWPSCDAPLCGSFHVRASRPN